MKKMYCPLNKNVIDITGCERCHKGIGREATRALCVIISHAKYIIEKPINQEIKENDVKQEQGPGHNQRSAGSRKKDLATCS